MSKRHIDGPPTRAKRTLRSVGSPPVNSAVRTAKMASIPIAFAGRHAAGVGKRVIGRSAGEVSRDIQVRTAQHMFEVLGELKTGAAKLGQIMSIYELALPPEIAEPYRTALTRLQHSAPAMLPPAVHDVLAASMGANWRDNFRTFDDRQPQAASVGQVHRAQWHDGRAVAVKVQYPGARQAMKSDLAQLKRVVAIGSIFMPGADLKALAAELSDRISEELEYSIEAANQRSFAAAYDGDPDFFVPDVVAQCGDVLVSNGLREHHFESDRMGEAVGARPDRSAADAVHTIGSIPLRASVRRSPSGQFPRDAGRTPRRRRLRRVLPRPRVRHRTRGRHG